MSYLDLYLNKNPLITSPNEGGEYSVIVYGIPFDSTHSFRPGTRFGPDAIRSSFNNIELFMPQFNVDLESANIQDLGNTAHTVVATYMLDMVSKITTELISKNKQLIILGGEHLITLGTYPCFPKNTGYIVFDAHYDLRDEYANTKLSHAAYLRRIIEKQGSDTITHVGARSYVKEELAFKKEHNVKSISNMDIRDGKAVKMIKDTASVFDKLYVSIDLDVLDPAFAPGVGNPEAVGITSRELYDMICALEDKHIIAADIVELCPEFDNGSTAAIAARLMSAIIAMNIK
ncbi:MAG: agmatinase [Nitrosopumilales archaeon]|nr:agmatinase [Nitrosopumilales archaeon]